MRVADRHFEQFGMNLSGHLTFRALANWRQVLFVLRVTHDFWVGEGATAHVDLCSQNKPGGSTWDYQ